MLQLQARAGGCIHKSHGPGRTGEEVDAIGQTTQLRRRLGIRHLQMVQAARSKTLELGLGQIGHIEIRVQPEAEGHGLATSLGGVEDRGHNLQRRRHWAHVHLHAEGEGIGRPGVGGVDQAEPHTALVLEQFKRPGEIAGKAMLLEGVRPTGQGQAVVRQVAADGK